MNRATRALRSADALQQRHAWLAVPVAVWKKFGDEVRALRLWPRSIAPPPYTEQDLRAYQLYAQVEQRREDMEIVAEVGGSEG
jgi:hypothetical protein